MTELFYIVGRVLFGGFFVMMGMSHFIKMNMIVNLAQSKGVPQARMGVIVSGILFLFGGIGVIFSVHVELAVFALVAALLPVSFLMHRFWTLTDPGRKMTEMLSFLRNLAFIGAALMIL